MRVFVLQSAVLHCAPHRAAALSKQCVLHHTPLAPSSTQWHKCSISVILPRTHNSNNNGTSRRPLWQTCGLLIALASCGSSADGGGGCRSHLLALRGGGAAVGTGGGLPFERHLGRTVFMFEPVETVTSLFISRNNKFGDFPCRMHQIHHGTVALSKSISDNQPTPYKLTHPTAARRRIYGGRTIAYCITQCVINN